jgi:serine/threonine-protein kinase
MQKLMQHQTSEPEPLRQRRPDVPEDLAAVVQRMMAKRPEDRFQIPLLVVAALRRFCPGAGVSSGLFRTTANGGGRHGTSTTCVAVARPGGSGSDRPSSSFNFQPPPQE